MGFGHIPVSIMLSIVDRAMRNITKLEKRFAALGGKEEGER